MRRGLDNHSHEECLGFLEDYDLEMIVLSLGSGDHLNFFLLQVALMDFDPEKILEQESLQENMFDRN
jgi:hypothetical protein